MHAEREGGEGPDQWQSSPLPRSSNLGFLSFLSANKKGGGSLGSGRASGHG
jgi:hypothetical protein